MSAHPRQEPLKEAPRAFAPGELVETLKGGRWVPAVVVRAEGGGFYELRLDPPDGRPWPGTGFSIIRPRGGAP